MSALCPSTGRSCSRSCVNRLRGGACLLADEREHTLEEVARELRVDERSVRRIEARALAKCRAMLDPEISSTVIAAILRVPRRFPGDRAEDLPRRFRPLPRRRTAP